MALGGPETDVFAAADAVLAWGERPTVELVHLELGRGSPARVGGLLDQWWSRLSERLNGETRLPALPGEVSQAFIAVWQQAIHLAQGVAEQALAEQRQLLIAERERVAVVENQARQDAADAVAGRQAAELRLADLELLLSQCQMQIGDLQQQRESLLHERREAQQHNQTLQQDLQALRLKAEQERVAQEVYIRGVEDRAHREVDRAREEGRAMTAELKAVGSQVEQLQRRLESIQNELTQTQQRAVAQQARAEKLEKQLTQVRQATSVQRKPRSRKPTATKSNTSG